MKVPPEDLTDDELQNAIDQLGAEVAMPGPSPTEKLKEHQEEAEKRGLFY
jgi:hypothetical protein